MLTGGYPLRRPDIFELVKYSSDHHVRFSLTPSATPLLTRESVIRLKECGLARLAVSLDGLTAGIHDAFRCVAGSYEWTLTPCAGRVRSACRCKSIPRLPATTWRCSTTSSPCSKPSTSLCGRFFPPAYGPRLRRRSHFRPRARRGIPEAVSDFAARAAPYQEHRSAELSPLSTAAPAPKSDGRALNQQRRSTAFLNLLSRRLLRTRME